MSWNLVILDLKNYVKLFIGILLWGEWVIEWMTELIN